MTAKITASSDGTKVNIGTASEDALQIDATGKTIKAVSPYSFSGSSEIFASVVFVGNGANGPCAIGSSHGVANVTKTGTGAYDIYFSEAQPNNEYIMSVTCDANGPGFLALPFINNSSTLKAAVLSYNIGMVPADATRIHVMFNRP